MQIFLNDMRITKQCIDDQCVSISDHVPTLEHAYLSLKFWGIHCRIELADNIDNYIDLF